MTVERLRAHLFSGHQAPFWNYEPDLLTLGLEVEFFIARVNGRSFELATKQQFLAVIDRLVRVSGYYDRNLASQPGRISKDTEQGFIAIKPDFAWHIIEVALPPRRRLEEIRRLLEETLEELDTALRVFGLQRLDISCLPNVPKHLELVELDRLSGFFDANAAVRPGVLGDLRVFPALITATHVHVNCSDEKSLALMPTLYAREQEALARFTRANIFEGKRYTNVRTEFYEQAFGAEYKLRTVPQHIPQSLQTYVDQMNESPGIFPFDPFFPVRDMSYIRPTRHGTVEFRSSCSFVDVSTLIEIAAFRRNQVLEAHNIDPPDTVTGRCQ